jgi:hypothetical protein
LRRFGSERPLHGTVHDALMATPVLGSYFRRMGVLPAPRSCSRQRRPASEPASAGADSGARTAASTIRPDASASPVAARPMIAGRYRFRAERVLRRRMSQARITPPTTPSAIATIVQITSDMHFDACGSTGQLRVGRRARSGSSSSSCSPPTSATATRTDPAGTRTEPDDRAPGRSHAPQTLRARTDDPECRFSAPSMRKLFDLG